MCRYSLASKLDNQHNLEKNVLSKFTAAAVSYLGDFKTPCYIALSYSTLYVELFI